MTVAVTEHFPPILQDLTSMMVVEIVVGEDQNVTVLHDQKLSYILKWVEFDAAQKTLIFVASDGRMQPVGLVMPDKIVQNIQKMNTIPVIRVGKEKAEDVYVVPLMNTDYGLA